MLLPFAREGESDTRYSLRVTMLVAVGMIAHVALGWVLCEPSNWRWLTIGFSYLVGGYRIALDSWRELRDEHLLWIDFLMGLEADGAAIVGQPLEWAILIFLFSHSNTLEHFAMGRTRSAIKELMKISPPEATLLDEAERGLGRVAVEELVAGSGDPSSHDAGTNLTPQCIPWTSPANDQAPTALMDSQLRIAISRKTLNRTTDGRETLQHTRTGARDFEYHQPLLRSLRK